MKLTPEKLAAAHFIQRQLGKRLTIRRTPELSFLADETIEDCREQAGFGRLTGGRKRGIEDRQSHFRKGVVGDWKNHLKPATVNRIDEIAGDQLAEQLAGSDRE